MSKTTLADIERLCWHLSGWQVDQRSVDALLKAVAEYAGYGPDQQPGDGVQSSGAGAPWPSGGAGDAERPAESLSGACAADDTPDPVIGAQTAVQRVEVSGTVRLVCERACAAPDDLPRAASGRFAPRARPLVSGGVKVCTKCQQARPVEDFSRDAKGNGGRRYACRDCENTRKREAAARKRAAKAQARAA